MKKRIACVAEIYYRQKAERRGIRSMEEDIRLEKPIAMKAKETG